MRRRCGGCGQVYHIPTYIMKYLSTHGNVPECPLCGSHISNVAEPVCLVGEKDAPVQSYL